MEVFFFYFWIFHFYLETIPECINTALSVSLTAMFPYRVVAVILLVASVIADRQSGRPASSSTVVSIKKATTACYLSFLVLYDFQDSGHFISAAYFLPY